MKSEELKPCPFCGAKAEAYHHMEISYDYWYVECSEELNYDGCCEARTSEYNTMEDAIEAWNERV